MTVNLSKQGSKRYSGVFMSFTHQTVTKTQNEDRAHLEFKKTKQGEAIGQITGFFEVPKIVDHNLRAGSITFNRLYGLRSLAEVLSKSKDQKNVIKKTAYALAAIHNHRPIPNEMTTQLDINCNTGTGSIFIHGDYSTMNLYLNDSNNLVVLDWSTAAWIGGNGNETGPCYLDLGIFILSLFFHRPFEAYQIKKPGNLVPVFLNSYCTKYDYKFDLDEFKRYFIYLIDIFVHAPRSLRAKLRVLSCQPTIYAAKKCVRKLYISKNQIAGYY